MVFHCIEITDPAMAQTIRPQIITRPNIIIMRKHQQPQFRHAKIIRVVICAMSQTNVAIGISVAAIKRIRVVNAKHRCRRDDAMQNGNGTAFEGIQRTVESRHQVYKNAK